MVEELCDFIVRHSVPAVIATTGQTEGELAMIDEAARHVPIFRSGNMLVGVALLIELAKKTAAVMPDADIEIIERHHNRKEDAPSGTALMIADAIRDVRGGAEYKLGRAGHERRTPGEIGINAVRAGGIVGVHEVLVCTDTQSITLKHEAYSRSLFAEGALEAAFKYLVVGSIGSAFILTAIVMLYAEAHTLNLAQLSVLLPGMLGSGRMKIAFALLLAGFSTKAFIVPFHPLAADAHGAAPASVSLLISGVLTKSGLYAIIRLCYFLFQVMDKGTMQFLLVFLGCVSMLVCVTMALAQHDFKRLLAFHSISQIGYVLTAVGLATALGLSAGLYHAMNHTIFKGLLFLAAGAVMHQTGTGDLDRLGGLAKKMPHTTVMFLIGAFSISGLPPFNGFASKWMIYQAIYQKAVESGNFLFVFALIAALVTSVLTLASFVKVSQSVFFGQLSVEFENTEEAPIGMRIAMGLLAALCVITGLFPNLVTAFLTEPAATAALNAGKYISAMGFDTTLAAPVISFVSMGVWAPVNWLLLLCITLLAITIAAVSTRYDAARTAENVTDTKYQLFYGGEKNVYSQVGGEDLFWGLKHNWRHYFDFMHKLHSGVVNDYALWAVVDVTVIMAFMLIAL